MGSESGSPGDEDECAAEAPVESEIGGKRGDDAVDVEWQCLAARGLNGLRDVKGQLQVRTDEVDLARDVDDRVYARIPLGMQRVPVPFDALARFAQRSNELRRLFAQRHTVALGLTHPLLQAARQLLTGAAVDVADSEDARGHAGLQRDA